MKPGDIVFVKTSGEVGFIYAVSKDAVPAVLPQEGQEPFGEVLSDQQVAVRVPVVSRDGIYHEIRDFFLSELETFEERLQRENAEYTLHNRYFGQRMQAAQPAQTSPKVQ